MSEFDRAAADVWDEVSQTFGDEVVWVQQDGTRTSGEAHLDAEYAEIGAAAGEKIVTAEFSLDDFPRPIQGDTCRVLTGLLAGEYDYREILEDDGNTITVRMSLVI